MGLPVKSIYLLADSQLLFWQEGDRPFLQRVREELEAASPKAAYVGASNGDLPEFFELFRGAMEAIEVRDCRMIPAEPQPADLEFFDQADLVLLAGGDVRLGWRAFKKSGLHQKLTERYYDGAVLIGVSAGAVQLGLHGWYDDDAGELRLFDCLKLVPAVIDVHEEPDWQRLARLVAQAEEGVQGLGIPSGGGAVVHPDLSVEPVRRALVELRRQEDGELRPSLIFPPQGGEVDAAGDAATGP